MLSCRFAEWKVRCAPRVLRMAVVNQSSVRFGKKRVFLVGTINFTTITTEVATSKLIARVHNPPECATPIQLCIGSWSSRIGSSDVMRTLHTSARPVSRQGTIVFDPRVPATPRVPLRCVLYYDAKIRLRSIKTLCRAGSGVAHSRGLCTLVNS